MRILSVNVSSHWFSSCIKVHMIWQLEFLLLQEQSFTSSFFANRSWILTVLPAFVSPFSPIAYSIKPLLPNKRYTWHPNPNWTFTLWLSDTPVLEIDVELASSNQACYSICSRAKFSLSITLSCFVSVQIPHLKYHLHPLAGNCFLGHLGQYFWDILSHSLPA